MASEVERALASLRAAISLEERQGMDALRQDVDALRVENESLREELRLARSAAIDPTSFHFGAAVRNPAACKWTCQFFKAMPEKARKGSTSAVKFMRSVHPKATFTPQPKVSAAVKKDKEVIETSRSSNNTRYGFNIY